MGDRCPHHALRSATDGAAIQTTQYLLSSVHCFARFLVAPDVEVQAAQVAWKLRYSPFLGVCLRGKDATARGQ
eukprot:2766657-Pyramimonas_sp.AAC.1